MCSSARTTPASECTRGLAARPPPPSNHAHCGCLFLLRLRLRLRLLLLLLLAASCRTDTGLGLRHRFGLRCPYSVSSAFPAAWLLLLLPTVFAGTCGVPRLRAMPVIAV
jgi:hypothetical protein